MFATRDGTGTTLAVFHYLGPDLDVKKELVDQTGSLPLADLEKVSRVTEHGRRPLQIEARVSATAGIVPAGGRVAAAA